MDQLASAMGQEGHALLMDFTSLEVVPVPMPAGVDVVVVHSGQARALAASAYAERRAESRLPADVIGPLREASEVPPGPPGGPGPAPAGPPRRHREPAGPGVRRLPVAWATWPAPAGSWPPATEPGLGDFEVSTPALDALVAELSAVPGVVRRPADRRRLRRVRRGTGRRRQPGPWLAPPPLVGCDDRPVRVAGQ